MAAKTDRFIREIAVRNVLSFGPEPERLTLNELNVLVGANGSGKSNLIDIVSLFRSAPRLLAAPVRDNGGILDWLWKGDRSPIARVEIVVEPLSTSQPIRHYIEFTESGQKFELVDERIENAAPYSGEARPYFYFGYENGRPMLNVNGVRRHLQREEVDPEQSILSQRKDPDQYPEITYLAREFDRIRIYREWSFGRYTVPRQPQRADQRNEFLAEDFSNLGLVLNRLRREPDVKSEILERLNELYPTITDFDIQVEGGSVQVFLQEGRFTIPATRLSDGTLRYLCLLAILCHPTPPPVVCLEEPELGLHPDVITSLGRLLKEASGRMQLIVTTHSPVLLDVLSKTPEDVVVCEKVHGATTMRRLSEVELAEWLGTYSLGELWRSGEIGGNRW